MTVANIFEQVPTALPEELFEVICSRPGVTIERILSQGHVSSADAWYDQAWDEWVLLLQGQATLGFEHQAPVSLRAGDYLLIPAHARHQVLYTSSEPSCIWLAIHLR